MLVIIQVLAQKLPFFFGRKVYSDNVIGNDCVIHAGAIIGADGFGFAPQSDDNYKKIAQIGNVIIEDNVEIGANTTIDRATLGSTIIRKGVKLDNLIQIAHNVEIGENTVIAAQSGVAGSGKVGRNCMIAAQVGIVGHLSVGNNVKIAGQSGISTSLPDESIVMGSPAFDAGKYKKAYVHFRNLQNSLIRWMSWKKRSRKWKANRLAANHYQHKHFRFFLFVAFNIQLGIASLYNALTTLKTI